MVEGSHHMEDGAVMLQCHAGAGHLLSFQTDCFKGAHHVQKHSTCRATSWRQISDARTICIGRKRAGGWVNGGGG